ncbi:hypothetical protein V2I01_32710 [Micromonospora sp. BRA006-A]|nr:hypothetical protein [Micromonospora sp. BRA006-A]
MSRVAGRAVRGPAVPFPRRRGPPPSPCGRRRPGGQGRMSRSGRDGGIGRAVRRRRPGPDGIGVPGGPGRRAG